MAKTSLQRGRQTGLSASTTYFRVIGVAGGLVTETDESLSRAIWRTAGTLSDLAVYISVNDRGESTTRTRKNGANGNQVITIPASTTGHFRDTSNTDTIAAGDEWNAQTVVGAGGTEYSSTHLKLVFAPSSDTVTRLMPSRDQNLTASNATRYISLAGDQAQGTNEARVQVEARTAATWRNFAVRVSTFTRSNPTTYSNRINGGNGSLVVSVSGTGTHEDTSNTDSVAIGDLCNHVTTNGAGSGSCRTEWLVSEWVTTNSKGQLLSTSTSVASLSFNASRFDFVSGLFTLASTTEADRQSAFHFAGTASEAVCYLETNSFDAVSLVTLNKNGVATALQISVTASTTGIFKDTANSVTFTDTDLAAWHTDTTASTAGSGTWTYIGCLYEDTSAPPAGWGPLLGGKRNQLVLTA